MKDHYFTSDIDGALHDTRVKDWSHTLLRSNYKRHHRDIKSVADFKATLRAGPYAWPGGYLLYFITSDGAALSFKSARENFALIARAIQEKDTGCGWHITNCDVNYEDNNLYCDDSGELIESACAHDD